MEVGGERCLISVITDITERKQAEEAVLRHARQLAALNKAGQTIVSALDLGTVLKQLIAEIRPLFEAEAASVLLCDPARGDLVFAAALLLDKFAFELSLVEFLPDRPWRNS